MATMPVFRKSSVSTSARQLQVEYLIRPEQWRRQQQMKGILSYYVLQEGHGDLYYIFPQKMMTERMPPQLGI
jgi:tellurite resistance-related uncharacterized protein